MSPTLPTAKVTVPSPTPFTLWTRRFLPWQLLRFVWINVKMLRMIVLSGPKRIEPVVAEAPRP